VSVSTRDKISLQEAASFLECSDVTVQKLLCDGRLPGLKMGHSWVIPREAFVQCVNAKSISMAEDLQKEAWKEKQNRIAREYVDAMPIAVKLTGIGKHGY
jgi:excisionase family DNA binding protein